MCEHLNTTFRPSGSACLKSCGAYLQLCGTQQHRIQAAVTSPLCNVNALVTQPQQHALTPKTLIAELCLPPIYSIKAAIPPGPFQLECIFVRRPLVSLPSCSHTHLSTTPTLPMRTGRFGHFHRSAVTMGCIGALNTYAEIGII